MRVLMVNSEDSWRGGEAQVELLIRGLVERGIETKLAAPKTSELARKVEAMGVALLPLPVSGGLELRAVRRLEHWLRREKFDLVHCHSSRAHGIAWCALAVSKRDKRPKLVVSRRVDFPTSPHGFSGWKYRRGVDCFLAVSQGVAKVLQRAGVREDRIAVVADGIDLAKFGDVGDAQRLRAEFRLEPQAVAIGNIAALAPHKSQKDFVSAARIIKNEIGRARFFIVGEGELRGALEKQIRESGLEREVIMTGFRKDVLGILSLFQCFVLSSYLEGLCTSVMDAQAMGIPVVATRTGGVPDLVDHEETGLLVEPRDPPALASAVIRMLGDEHLRSRCVAQALARAQGYGWANMVEGTLSAYRRVLAGQELSSAIPA